MDFGANKTPVEVIREGAFGGIYFKDIYYRVNGKWYKNSWKEFNQLKDIDQKFYSSNIIARFWENKGWINEIDPSGWFQGYFRYWLGRGLEDDERQINRWILNFE